MKNEVVCLVTYKNQRTKPVKAYGSSNKFQNMPPSDTLLPAKPHLVKLTNIPQILAKERDQTQSNFTETIRDLCFDSNRNIKDTNPKGQCILRKETSPFHTN